MAKGNKRNNHICVNCYYLLHHGCRYMDNEIPVAGWTAEKNRQGYEVTKCPKFKTEVKENPYRFVNEEEKDIPYMTLATEIVRQAVKDYRSALSELRRKHTYSWHIDDCERFFHSDWCYNLTNMDGDKMIRMVRTDVGVDDDEINRERSKRNTANTARSR